MCVFLGMGRRSSHSAPHMSDRIAYRCSTERECHDMLKAALKNEGGRMMSADAVANFWEAWGCGT